MAKGYSISIASETKPFATGVQKGVIEPLEDAADVLQDIGRDGGRSVEQLEQDMRGAQARTDEVRKGFSDLQKQIRETGRKSRTDFAEPTNRSTQSVKEDLRELGDEGRQNAAEMFSSFDGSFTSIADAAQGTLGGVTAGLRGVPAIAAAAAGAAGLGLIVTTIEAANEDSQELREAIAELGAEFIETGQVGKRSLDGVIERLQALASETDEGKTSLVDLADAAARSGNRLDLLTRAYGSNVEQLDAMIAREQQLEAMLDREANVAMTRGQAAYDAHKLAADGQRLIVDELEKTRKEIEGAAAVEAAWLAAGGPELEAKAAAIGAVNQAYDQAAGALSTYVDEETGLFDVAAYIEAMEARTKALNDYQTALASADLSTEAKAFLAEQGADAAASFLAGYQNASPAQKAELNRIWSEAGRENSGEYAGALQQNMPDTVAGPEVRLNYPTSSEIQTRLDAIASRQRIRIPVDLVTRTGEVLYD